MANLNYNKATICGRLTADPELRQTASGTMVTTFSVAVNKTGNAEGKANFFNVVAWKGTAEFVTRYFHRGSSIFIDGSLHQRTWMDKDGNNRSAIEIVADKVYFVDSRGEHPAATPTVDGASVKFEVIEDDELPF